MKLKKIAALLTIAGISAPAFATNGAAMEGYGPVSTGMGGTSAAYDNGAAGLINNPATLGLMKSGTSRLDLAIGGLHPNISVSSPGQSTAKSDGTSYFLPAGGYIRKDGKLTWGIGLFAQGGMGAEYSSTSFLSGFVATDGTSRGTSGRAQRTELALGRVMVPLTYDVTDNLRIGGTVDYVWGGFDFKMQMSGQALLQLMGNQNNANKSALGFVNTSSTLLPTLAGLVQTANGGSGANDGRAINFGYFDVDRGNDKFSQAATTSGFASNIGFAWQATPALSIGGVYHAKTALSDFSGSGSMTMNLNAAAGTAAGLGGAGDFTLRGQVRVINLQWPSSSSIGIAYQANDKWLLAADVKTIGWRDTFQQLRMKFTTGSGTIDLGINQNFKDQNIAQLGVAYKATDALTLRAGASMTDNPVPAGNMFYLFPATEANHFTLGAGYAMNKYSSVDFSVAMAPSVSVTNPGNGLAGAGTGLTGIPRVTATHSQTNWQLMFSQRF